MAKKKLTAGQKAAQTRKKNEQKMLDQLGFERKKVKRQRKPMTPEQKEAAIARLAKAREARGLDGSKSIHHSIRDLDEDHFIHWKKVKQWIKSCEMQLKGIRSYKDSSKSAERVEYQDLEVYIKNMKNYLKSGHWSDFRYGENREHKVQRYSVAMAYYPDGTPKRDVGVFYPDIGAVWSKELEVIYYGENWQPNRTANRQDDIDEEEIFEDDRGDGYQDGDELS